MKTLKTKLHGFIWLISNTVIAFNWREFMSAISDHGVMSGMLAATWAGFTIGVAYMYYDKWVTASKEREK